MKYIIPTQNQSLITYDLSPRTCDVILDHYLNVAEVKANHSYVSCIQRWSTYADWIAPFIWNYISHANSVHYRFALESCIVEEVHFVEYRKGHQFKWHCDDCVGRHLQYSEPSTDSIRPRSQEYIRKLSFTLQLSDPDQYSGGQLQFLNDKTNSLFSVPQQRGLLTIFDSRTRHRVRAVETGSRKVLVGWILGPRWK